MVDELVHAEAEVFLASTAGGQRVEAMRILQRLFPAIIAVDCLVDEAFASRSADMHDSALPRPWVDQPEIVDTRIPARTPHSAHVDRILRFPQHEREAVHRTRRDSAFVVQRSLSSISSKDVPVRSDGL